MSEEEKKEWVFDLTPSPEYQGEGYVYHCYMSSDPFLTEAYLDTKGLLYPSVIQWRLCPNADQNIVNKMKDLNVHFALCSLMSDNGKVNTGFVDAYWYEEGQIWHVPGDILRNPEEQIIFECDNQKDLKEDISELKKISTLYADLAKNSTNDGIISSLYLVLCILRIVTFDLHKQIQSGCCWGYRGILLLKEWYDDEYPYFPFLDSFKRPILFGDKILDIKGDFFEVLRCYRECQGMDEVSMYKKAGVSKQTYSKIKSGKVIPKRETVMAFSVALNLSAKDTDVLLSSAGYTFRLEDAIGVIAKAIEFLLSDE